MSRFAYLEVFDKKTGNVIERVNVRGELYRHVWRAEEILNRLLDRAIDRQVIPGPRSRYCVQALKRIRLCRGGGIAGHQHSWKLVVVDSGTALTPLCTTAQELRRALLEFEAGPRPVVRSGWTAYAKRSKNRFGIFTIWVVRRSKVGSKRLKRNHDP